MRAMRNLPVALICRSAPFLCFPKIRSIIRPIPPRSQRDVSRSSRHVRRGCGGRGCAWLTSGTEAYGEIVWSWRPERSGAKLPTMLAHRGDDGGKRNGSPGRARISC